MNNTTHILRVNSLVSQLPVSPGSQIHGLGGSDHRDGQHHVVTDLHRLAHADVATVDDVFPHGLQQLLGGGEPVLRAAHHKRQGGTARGRHAWGGGKGGDGVLEGR